MAAQWAAFATEQPHTANRTAVDQDDTVAHDIRARRADEPRGCHGTDPPHGAAGRCLGTSEVGASSRVPFGTIPEPFMLADPEQVGVVVGDRCSELLRVVRTVAAGRVRVGRRDPVPPVLSRHECTREHAGSLVDIACRTQT